jgi:hypothetical protein
MVPSLVDLVETMSCQRVWVVSATMLALVIQSVQEAVPAEVVMLK